MERPVIRAPYRVQTITLSQVGNKVIGHSGKAPFCERAILVTGVTHRSALHNQEEILDQPPLCGGARPGKLEWKVELNSYYPTACVIGLLKLRRHEPKPLEQLGN